MLIEAAPELHTSLDNRRVQAHFDNNVSLYVDKVLKCYEDSSRERLKQLEEVMPDLISTQLRLLDVGCGGGFFIDLFLSHFARATAWGIDLSQGMLQQNTPAPRKHLRQADALHLPPDLGAFNVINVDTVMHHLIRPESYDATLKQIRRFLSSLHGLLTPGGVVMIREIFHEYRVIETFGTRTIFELSTLQVPHPVERLLKFAGIKTANAGVCFLSRAQWKQLFAEAGFTIIAVQEKAWTSQPYRRFGFAASGDIHYIIGRTRPRVF